MAFSPSTSTFRASSSFFIFFFRPIVLILLARVSVFFSLPPLLSVPPGPTLPPLFRVPASDMSSRYPFCKVFFGCKRTEKVSQSRGRRISQEKVYNGEVGRGLFCLLSPGRWEVVSLELRRGRVLASTESSARQFTYFTAAAYFPPVRRENKPIQIFGSKKKNMGHLPLANWIDAMTEIRYVVGQSRE